MPHTLRPSLAHFSLASCSAVQAKIFFSLCGFFIFPQIDEITDVHLWSGLFGVISPSNK